MLPVLLLGLVVSLSLSEASCEKLVACARPDPRAKVFAGVVEQSETPGSGRGLIKVTERFQNVPPDQEFVEVWDDLPVRGELRFYEEILGVQGILTRTYCGWSGPAHVNQRYEFFRRLAARETKTTFALVVWPEISVSASLANGQKRISLPADVALPIEIEPGQYQLSYEVPSGFEDVDRGPALKRLNLEAGYCHEHNLWLRSLAGIRGTVRDHQGVPAEDVSVIAEREDPDGKIVAYPPLVKSSSNGEFELNGIEPGRYVVRTKRRDLTFQPTYFPSVAERSRSERAEVSPGVIREHVNIVLLPARETVCARIRVIDPAGQSIRGVSVYLRNEENEFKLGSTNGEGWIQTEILAESGWELEARMVSRASDQPTIKRVRRPLQLNTDRGTSEIVITLVLE